MLEPTARVSTICPLGCLQSGGLLLKFQSPFLIILFFSLNATSQIISPSGREVKFSYSTTVWAPVGQYVSALDLATLQAQHMFGIFASREFVAPYGINPDQTESIGAPSKTMKIEIKSVRTLNGQKIVEYTNSGRLILEKTAAQEILSRGQFSVPLPKNPFEIYDKKCTDSHYTEFSDYWYFFNPFRGACSRFSVAPYSDGVTVKVSAAPARSGDLTPRLDLVRGGNRNGSAFLIYVVHGYSDSSTSPRDDGRKSFKQFNTHMRELGFAEEVKRPRTTYPLHLYTKAMTFNGKKADVEIRHLLVETDIESRNVSFAKFFREAVENADVIIYAGHSGLGSNLDIPLLETKAGKFSFPRGKRQIYFFEACSSYSYYLEPFRAEKTLATIDIVTNGLSSYFHTGDAIMRVFMNYLLNEDIDDAPWLEILEAMEQPLGGGSYLTNVGGI